MDARWERNGIRLARARRPLSKADPDRVHPETARCPGAAGHRDAGVRRHADAGSDAEVVLPAGTAWEPR